MGTAELLARLVSIGVHVPYDVADRAMRSVDRAAVETGQRQRYRAVVWDGQDAPPVGERGRWLQLTQAQLAKWDAMSPAERQAYLPRAHYLMVRRNRGLLTAEEAAEAETMPVPHDAIGLATLEAAANGKAMYFLLVDGELGYWQPFAAHTSGRILMELTDEQHPQHWRKMADQHIAREVEREADAKHLDLALSMVLSGQVGTDTPG